METIFNKGTHYEDEKKEFERSDVRAVIDYLNKLDDLVRNLKIKEKAYIENTILFSYGRCLVEEGKMIIYKNCGGNSNVYAFEIGEKYIDVCFNGGKVYRYSYNSAGKDKVEQMKLLANQGHGLNSYIMRYAKYDYER